MIVTERDARNWLIATFDVPRETMDRLEAFVALLRTENDRQNLVARSTLPHIWVRHIADSAQLLRFSPSQEATWLDLGSGAGFPGLIVALFHHGPVTLVESRRLRVGFLERAADLLGIAGRTAIVLSRAERVPPRAYDVISARALANLRELVELTHPFSTEKTRWILPKGRSAQSELEQAEPSWQGEFRLEPSLTDPDARIIVAERVRPRGRRKPT